MRTLYYRLLRLLALSVQPLFVFDGPHKPSFKRGKNIASGAACLPDFLTKELLKRFGFSYHTAPGEAEAECALLQREGIVDAVLSEDVDTLMFGCGMSLRSWTAEGTRGNKSPTHVNVYNAKTTKATAGLDAEGMILVALMSGGDYVPAGIPGCGPKIACEAAKAGFGGELCKIARCDGDGLCRWRERLQRELQTNESKFFRQKHKALRIPDNFPDATVLGYYVRPAVSSAEKLAKLRRDIVWNAPIDVPGLRLFVADAFNWPYLIGAKKFIRGLAPALLAHQLIRNDMTETEQSLESRESSEAQLVKAICGRRSHWNTDGTPELRIAYIPNAIVKIDLDLEEDEDIETYGREVSEDEQQQASGGEEAESRSRSPIKKRAPSAYDPTEIEKIWMLETYVKLGVPLLVETWEEDMRDPRKFAARKARERRVLARTKATVNAAVKAGPMEQFVKISKPGVSKPVFDKPDGLSAKQQDIYAPPVFLAPATATIPPSPRKSASPKKPHPSPSKSKNQAPKTLRRSKPSPIQYPSSTQTSLPPPKSIIDVNPWTLSKRPSDTLRYKSPTRYSALGIYPLDDPEHDSSSPHHNPKHHNPNSNLTTKAFASPPTTPTPRRKRPATQPTTPSPPPSPNPTLEPHTPHNHHPTGLATPTTHTRTRTRTRDASKPSPRKKRSPLEMANELFVAGALKTPDFVHKTKTDDIVTLDPEGETEGGVEEQPLTAKKVNRKLHFSEGGEAGVESSLQGSDSLADEGFPSPSALFEGTTYSRSPLQVPSKPKNCATCDRRKAEVGAESRQDTGNESRNTTKDQNQPPSSPSPLNPPPPPNPPAKQTKSVALRESLEGAWRVLEGWEVDESVGAKGRERGRGTARGRGRGRKGVFAGVEVLDLTGG